TARPGLGVLPNPPEACLGPMAPTVLQAHTAPPPTVSREGGQEHGFTDELMEKKKDAAFAASFLFVCL
ncbi:hypothetical protein, partial [Stenotrophomonas sp. 3(2025)]|uniref:hypothetical protein n=1 Tax=Stenotrophomonas sp. 3(2025) TaxID=3456023 RepID=UPI004044CEA9